MYMLRAYQSPISGAHCALQCAQMPNLASRNQSGVRYPSTSESHVGAKAAAEVPALAPKQGSDATTAADWINDRRDKFVDMGRGIATVEGGHFLNPADCVGMPQMHKP